MKTPIVVLQSTVVEDNVLTEKLNKFSTFGKLQRVMAYMLRFLFNCRHKEKRIGSLSVEELNTSLMTCVRLYQLVDFKEDIHSLSKAKMVSNRLRKLNPFLDKQQLLRVGGRLINSDLPEAEKHPLLLSKQSNLSRLLCVHFHKMLLHAGPRTTRAIIQKKFWIISAHSLLRKIIFNCKNCHRWHAKPLQPTMGALPPSRVQLSRCFASTTLDIGGPFNTKESNRRKSVMHKSYFCVFVCEATKAVHLEALTDLSTSCFLAAFDRFSSRRSLPCQLRSDNGKNFIGASRVLKECQQFFEDHHEEIFTALASRQVKWCFNPAYGPHFGGLHESAVKSTKNLLKKQVGEYVFTFEEFSTVLTRIEAVLNSRPLSFVTSDPQEGIHFLSPGHFLVGGPLISSPEMPLDLTDTPVSRWKKLQQLCQLFWKRFHKEYLHTLMQQGKWTKNTDNLSNGQLVYVTGENCSPLAWPIGRVVATYPGTDGVVRVVDIQTISGRYRRPVNKLVVVPMEQ